MQYLLVIPSMARENYHLPLPCRSMRMVGSPWPIHPWKSCELRHPQVMSGCDCKTKFWSIFSASVPSIRPQAEGQRPAHHEPPKRTDLASDIIQRITSNLQNANIAAQIEKQSFLWGPAQVVAASPSPLTSVDKMRNPRPKASSEHIGGRGAQS